MLWTYIFRETDRTWLSSSQGLKVLLKVTMKTSRCCMGCNSIRFRAEVVLVLGEVLVWTEVVLVPGRGCAYNGRPVEQGCIKCPNLPGCFARHSPRSAKSTFRHKISLPVWCLVSWLMTRHWVPGPA